jgi:hypothetical protein
MRHAILKQPELLIASQTHPQFVRFAQHLNPSTHTHASARGRTVPDVASVFAESVDARLVAREGRGIAEGEAHQDLRGQLEGHVDERTTVIKHQQEHAARLHVRGRGRGRGDA